MKNQITTAQKWVQGTLTVLLTIMISFSSFAQMPGGGPGTGGHPGGPHPGGPGGGWPHPGGPGWPHPSLTCNADFAHHRDTIVNGVRFFNLPGTGAATYAWDFGDGSTSTDANPAHTYADSGWYNVCLTITDTIGGGCTDTQCDSIHVFTPGPRCNAHFMTRPDSIANGVRFHAARGWHMGATSTATYSWDFGDGNTSTDPNPTNVYSAAGTYYVCLTVSNSNAGGTCSNTWCDSVNTNHPGPWHPHHIMAPGDSNGDAAMKTTNSNGEMASQVLVSVYPNPMSESTTVHIENTSGNVTFRIYNSTGQIALTKVMVNGDNKISKENLSSGLYFYTIDDGDSNVAKGKLKVD